MRLGTPCLGALGAMLTLVLLGACGSSKHSDLLASTGGFPSAGEAGSDSVAGRDITGGTSEESGGFKGDGGAKDLIGGTTGDGGSATGSAGDQSAGATGDGGRGIGGELAEPGGGTADGGTSAGGTVNQAGEAIGDGGAVNQVGGATGDGGSATGGAGELSGGSSGAGGAGGAGHSGGATSVACTANDDCEAGAYCAKQVGDCEGKGECAELPTVCPGMYSPVCGCDATTYGNSCEASVAEVSIAYQGECATSCALSTVWPGCCFDDGDCGSGERCVSAACTLGGEGICKPTAVGDGCWTDEDCGGNCVCRNVQICRCGMLCLVADQQGVCDCQGAG